MLPPGIGFTTVQLNRSREDDKVTSSGFWVAAYRVHLPLQ